MADQRVPNDPYRNESDPEIRDPSRLDSELQPDPELAEGPASGGKIAAFAVAIAVILGAVFYGLNNSSVDHAGTSSSAQNSAQPQNAAPPQSTAQNQPSPQAAPPGMRDVTPHANTSPGVTTGAAPARPQNPPSAGPTGQDVNRSSNPPANNAPAK
jgi:uncharacterized protein HemX